MEALMASIKNKSPQATSMEYVLLARLVEHAGEAVPRAILLRLTRKVDMHIKGLRRKLGVYADQYIETVVGAGYRFRPWPEP